MGDGVRFSGDNVRSDVSDGETGRPCVHLEDDGNGYAIDRATVGSTGVRCERCVTDEPGDPPHGQDDYWSEGSSIELTVTTYVE